MGIIGYGNIGAQVSTLAEAMGLRVIYFDIVSKLSLGNAKPMSSLDDLLENSDFVTLHVPETDQTKGMIGFSQLKRMKKGSYLINASRGTVVDLQALEECLKNGHLAGCAIDVFPEEPPKNTSSFPIPLRTMPNTILTPHIGGATEEAQSNIAKEVAHFLSNFGRTGTTNHSVNFPAVAPQGKMKGHRIVNVHKNVPGVMRDINRIISESDANIESQYLATNEKIGYTIIDLNKEIAEEVMKEINKLKTSIKTRIIKSSPI